MWGFPATIALSALIWLLFNLIGFLVLRVLLAGYSAADSNFDSQAFTAGVGENGHVLALVTLISAPLSIVITLVAIRLRQGLEIADYLALNLVRPGTVFKWVAVLLLTMAVIEFAGQLSDHPVTSDYVINTYRTATLLPIFWLAVTVIGPVFEEVLFRGFMYKGVAASRLGVAGAIVLSSLVWTLAHFQYGTFELVVVFLLGIVLGLARAKTQSLYTPLILHSLVNIVALTTASYYSG